MTPWTSDHRGRVYDFLGTPIGVFNDARDAEIAAGSPTTEMQDLQERLDIANEDFTQLDELYSKLDGVMEIIEKVAKSEATADAKVAKIIDLIKQHRNKEPR